MGERNGVRPLAIAIRIALGINPWLPAIYRGNVLIGSELAEQAQLPPRAQFYGTEFKTPAFA